MTREEFYKIWFDEWHFCGCGSPEEAVRQVAACLEYIKGRSETPLKVPLEKNKMPILIMYWLAAVDLTEHGGSVYGAWLSEKGKAVLEYAKTNNDDRLASFEEFAEWQPLLLS